MTPTERSRPTRCRPPRSSPLERPGGWAQRPACCFPGGYLARLGTAQAAWVVTDMTRRYFAAPGEGASFAGTGAPGEVGDGEQADGDPIRVLIVEDHRVVAEGL